VAFYLHIDFNLFYIGILKIEGFERGSSYIHCHVISTVSLFECEFL